MPTAGRNAAAASWWRDGMPMKGTPRGAPADVKAGADGAIYLTEYRNGTVLRIAAQQ